MKPEPHHPGFIYSICSLQLFLVIFLTKRPKERQTIAGQRTCDQQVVSSTPGRALPG